MLTDCNSVKKKSVCFLEGDKNRVFSENALKKQFLTEKCPGSGRESFSAFLVPEALVLSIAGFIDYPKLPVTHT